jgi:hypothetical protein
MLNLQRFGGYRGSGEGGPRIGRVTSANPSERFHVIRGNDKNTFINIAKQINLFPKSTFLVIKPTS